MLPTLNHGHAAFPRRSACGHQRPDRPEQQPPRSVANASVWEAGGRVGFELGETRSNCRFWPWKLRHYSTQRHFLSRFQNDDAFFPPKNTTLSSFPAFPRKMGLSGGTRWDTRCESTRESTSDPRSGGAAEPERGPLQRISGPMDRRQRRARCAGGARGGAKRERGRQRTRLSSCEEG